MKQALIGWEESSAANRFSCAIAGPSFVVLASPPGRYKSSHSGFTLVELVVTLIIIGILAAFVAPRFFGTHGFEERGFYAETLSALRYAQKSALAQRRLVCVAFTDKTISLRIATNFGSANCSGANGVDLVGPDGHAYAVDANADTKYRNADIKFSPVPGALTFDAQGRPGAAATVQVAGFSQAITVEAETGYVH